MFKLLQDFVEMYRYVLFHICVNLSRFICLEIH